MSTTKMAMSHRLEPLDLRLEKDSCPAVQGASFQLLCHKHKVEGLDGLLLQAMHHVYHQDGNVTQA